MKRTVDVLGAALLLLLVLPTMIIVVVGSAIVLRTNPFFVQRRIGRGGECFSILKVRTLPREVPTYADKYQLAAFTVPRFCRLVRLLHLDELPQLFLVLRGRMSLVGPRPEMPTLHATLTPDFAALRTSIRPGCTGLWQVSERRNGLISESPEFDVFYVRHQSLRLDAWIAARTVRQMLPGLRTNPVRLADLPAWATGAATSRLRAAEA